MQPARILAIVLASLLAAGAGRAQLIISEFVASNGTSLPDEEGLYPDWIEIHNTSRGPVSTEGWYLTDDAENSTLWPFPAVTISGNDYLIVYASGNDRRDPAAPLHTNFSLDVEGDYLALIGPDQVTPATEFAPRYPEQRRDVSYGIGQKTTTTPLLAAGTVARILVPTDGALGLAWTAPDFHDTRWTTGPTGVGYESSVAGFAVRTVKAAVQVGSIATAEAVLASPAQQVSVTSRTQDVVNFRGTGFGGHFGSNQAFPGQTIWVDIDDFVVEVLATVTIPRAGAWTFGVNSDDGFSLAIGDGFSLAYPDPRGSSDSFGLFQVPAAGEYELRLVYFERGGSSCLELFAAEGAFSEWESGRFRLVGDTGAGGLAVRSAPVDGGSGSGGGGYRPLIQTDLQSAMYGRNASVYLRLPFDVRDPAELESLLLRVRCDDGFVAYLNGQEVARDNAPPAPVWDSAAPAARARSAALAEQEFNLSSYRGLIAPGRNLLAVHALNVAAADDDFLMLPELVDVRTEPLGYAYFDPPTPRKPNGTGFVEFVADTTFSVDRGFHDAPFTLAISCETPGAVIRYTTDGTPPTPSTGAVYTGPILIDRTTVLRAAAFKPGLEPSNVDTQTYIFLDDVIVQSPNGQAPPGWPSSWGANVVDYGMDPDVVNAVSYRDTIEDDLRSIPSFSVVMRLADLFDPAAGIYANSGQDGRQWERPASIELIYPDGTEGFQIDGGIRIRGGFSRSTDNPKHAFRLFFRSEYGAPKLRYPFFGDAGTDTFDALDLRTFQNYSWSYQADSRGVFLRDQFSRDSQLDMGRAGERGDFYHLYINGQYWGLYNTDERPEASFGASYFGGQPEDYDVVKVEAGPYSILATDGTLDAWQRLYNLAEAGLASDAAYQRIQGRNPDGTPNPDYEVLLDVPNLIDYMLVIFYGGNLDAPISNFLGNTRPNNWYGVRNRNARDGFRFLAHDSEHTLLNVSENRTGPFPAGTQFQYSNPQRIFQQLQANPEFRMLVADHVHRHFFNGGALTPEACLARFMRRKDEIDRAVVGESARWGDAKRSRPLTRDTEWVRAVDTIVRDFFPRRTSVVLSQLQAKSLYPTLVAPAFSQHGGGIERGFALTMTAPAGTVYYTLDGTDPRLPGGAVSPLATLYQGPVALDQNVTAKARALSGSTWSALDEADFVVIQTFTDLVLSEIMYHPSGETGWDADEFEFIELKNVGSQDLDLSGVHFSAGIRFAFPRGTRLGPGQLIVLAGNPDAFALRYPGVPIAGRFDGRLDNAGELLVLSHAIGSTIAAVVYDDRAPWPVTADGRGFSLVPIDPNRNLDPGQARNWRASSAVGGSPGVDDPPVAAATAWISELLTRDADPGACAVELHNPNADAVDIGGWYLSHLRNLPRLARIPGGFGIEPGGYRVLDAAAWAGTGLELNPLGGELYLFAVDGAGQLTGYSNGFAYGPAAAGVSFGRYTISTGEVHYPAQAARTLGHENVGPLVGPVVINEFSHRPAAGAQEFIELKNITNLPVDLHDPAASERGWRLEGIDFEFPAGAAIPAGGLVLVTAGAPDTFRIQNQVPESVPVLGPWTGFLEDGGELIRLSRPDAPVVDGEDGMVVPYITVDEVRYGEGAPWPSFAAGETASLERIRFAEYGNDPVNWRSGRGRPSPGLENGDNRLPQVDAGENRQVVSSVFPFALGLTATASDDGLPEPPGRMSYAWRQVEGRGTVVFDPPDQPATTAYVPGAGAYRFRFTAYDGAGEASDQVALTVERPSALVVLVPRGSEWAYLDDGSDQGVAWRALDFDASAWAVGPAQLGYGDGDEATRVSYGPDSGNKHITTYFRRFFEIPPGAAITGLKLQLLRDDGAVVYLNGNEVLRSNMPQGEIGYRTEADLTVFGPNETTFFESDTDAAHLVAGSNLIAVELHQDSPGDGDLSFDLELGARVSASNQQPIVDAGEDRAGVVPGPLLLVGQVSDDALPDPPGFVSVGWEKVDGPGEVIFDQPGAASTAARFALPGTYRLRLSATDGMLAASDEVTAVLAADDLAGWKSRHFTLEELAKPAIAGDDADPDGDGFSNGDEFTSGTDPRDGGDYLFIESVALGAPGSGETIIRFHAVAGVSYSVLEWDGTARSGWRRVHDVAARARGETIDLTLPATEGATAALYRLVTPAQP